MLECRYRWCYNHSRCFNPGIHECRYRCFFNDSDILNADAVVFATITFFLAVILAFLGADIDIFIMISFVFDIILSFLSANTFVLQ